MSKNYFHINNLKPVLSAEAARMASTSSLTSPFRKSVKYESWVDLKIS